MTRTSTRRLVAVGGALALAATAAFGLGGTAAADVGPDQPGAHDSGTLTVNKYAGVPLGEGETLADREKLTGVQFTVTRVGRLVGTDCVALDLTKAADWAGLDGTGGLFASAPAEPSDPFCLTETKKVQATVDGQTVFDLAVGIYYVEETAPGANQIVAPVPSFYVSIPTSDSAQAGGWDYSVVADPKNQLAEEPTKTITEAPSAPVVGSDVTWNLSVPVPTLAAGDTFESGSVSDVLDARLTYKSSTVKIGETTLAVGTDYTLDAAGVKWTFTPSVLDANQGKTISIELVTTVTAVGNGSIANPGGTENGYSSEFNGTTTPGGPTPYTYWGKLSINKTDDSTNPLKGAEFKVFNTAADGTCAATAPSTGSLATGSSDEAGVVRWAGVTPTAELGLWVANANAPLASPTRAYCVYETVVPAGHTATPIANPVIIKAETTALTLNVVNTKKTGPNLPLTGAGGAAVMMTGGLVLIGIGAVTMIALRRRRNLVA